MKQTLKQCTFLPLRMIVLLACMMSIIMLANSAFKPAGQTATADRLLDTKTDSIASVNAFNDVYKVLMHPRCMNCHPAGDVPLQGDDSHIHTMLPQRGKEGHGVYALKCTNCHQPANTPGVHTPPGNPKWALPPADMKMVFENRSAHDLAAQIMDYQRNGHKNKAQLIEHARDTLVKWAWNPGEGRTTPPLSYNEFVKAWDTWINTGGYAPGR